MRLKSNVKALEQQLEIAHHHAIQLQREKSGLEAEIQEYKIKEQEWNLEKSKLLRQIKEHESRQAQQQQAVTHDDMEVASSSSTDTPTRPNSDRNSLSMNTSSPVRTEQRATTLPHEGTHRTNHSTTSSATSEASYTSVHDTFHTHERAERVHVNSSFTDNINFGSSSNASSSKRKHRQPIPFKPGACGLTSWQWFLQFELLIDYNSWTKEDARAEFMLAMQGTAAQWWRNLDRRTKNDFDLAIAEFLDFYGGEPEDKRAAIGIVDKMRQGDEPMMTFGPTLKTAIIKVTSDPDLQLFYFYKTVNDKVRDQVQLREPKTLDEAVNYATRIDRSQNDYAPDTVKTSTPQQPPTVPSFGTVPTTTNQTNPSTTRTDGPTPMESVEMANNQAQFSNRHKGRNTGNQSQDKSRKSKNTGCHGCGKQGHFLRDCRYFTAFKRAQDQRSSRNYNNAQQITNPQEGFSDDDQLLDNFFHQVYSTTE